MHVELLETLLRFFLLIVVFTFLPIDCCVYASLVILVKFIVYIPARITRSLPELPQENDVAFRCLVHVLG